MVEIRVDSTIAKTLHNGLQVLEAVSSEPNGYTTTELAQLLGIHRTVVHRLVRTLEAHGLCRRDKGKRVVASVGLIRLAEGVEHDLRSLAQPVLEDLAEQTAATAHLVTQESPDAVRVLVVVEPRRAQSHIAFRPGRVDAIDRGSAGLAILASLPAKAGERGEVVAARGRGYAISYSEQIPYVHGLSAAIPGRPNGEGISIGVSVFELTDENALAREVVAAARRLGRRMGS